MTQHEILEVFSPLWWKANIISIVIIGGILSSVRFLTTEKRERLAQILGIFLIARAIMIHPYNIYLGNWSVQSNLPLQMCSISSILSGVVLLWRNQLAYEFLYFWGIPGAFHSFLTPEFTTGTQGFLFFEYYISHGGIILSALFLTMYLGMIPRQGSWFRIFLLSQISLPVIGGLNWLLDSNYMYLNEKPIADNPFLLGEWPWYILGLQIVGLLHFLLVYLPIGYQYRYGNKAMVSG